MTGSENKDRQIAARIERYYIYTKLAVPTALMCFAVLGIAFFFWFYDSYALSGQALPVQIIIMFGLTGCLLALFVIYSLVPLFRLRGQAWDDFLAGSYDGGADPSGNPDPYLLASNDDLERPAALDTGRPEAEEAGGSAVRGMPGSFLTASRGKLVRAAWRHNIAISRKKVRSAQALTVIIPILISLALGLLICL